MASMSMEVVKKSYRVPSPTLDMFDRTVEQIRSMGIHCTESDVACAALLMLHALPAGVQRAAIQAQSTYGADPDEALGLIQTAIQRAFTAREISADADAMVDDAVRSRSGEQAGKASPRQKRRA